mmetsp:Transcript_64672/g.107446  ORF Transcript_64672/g.107446 Transcript_64672/m.107446 type:complete len:102 (+) Transcript_64672:33-338(+)|eukprot:CAMPEP_0119326086 /NCGR_PEP_ID=MMETSP1333-20130426/67440_1 /TAXON_ID=418940 /ORGANISM="Scyphosphaera apsteinii, Strain RCC1455" /LENGTH=101 /DNA_ID=CAMNT_0007334281 /DNA_START=292 /DNA_END=597 /DNA_ORIENTATION=-
MSGVLKKLQAVNELIWQQRSAALQGIRNAFVFRRTSYSRLEASAADYILAEACNAAAGLKASNTTQYQSASTLSLSEFNDAKRTALLAKRLAGGHHGRCFL